MQAFSLVSLREREREKTDFFQVIYNADLIAVLLIEERVFGVDTTSFRKYVVCFFWRFLIFEVLFCCPVQSS